MFKLAEWEAKVGIPEHRGDGYTYLILGVKVREDGLVHIVEQIECDYLGGIVGIMHKQIDPTTGIVVGVSREYD